MSSIAVQQEAYNNYMDSHRMLYRIPVSDGWIPKSIHDLAQFGTWGGNPGNIIRELKHWLGEPILPTPMVITVPMIIPKPRTGEAITKDVQFPMLYPHDVISHVYHNHPDTFKSLYIGNSSGQETPDKLEEFWSTVDARGDPRLLQHPMTSRRHWKRTHVPLSLHGDAVPVTKVAKLAQSHGCVQYLRVTWWWHHKGLEAAHIWFIHILRSQGKQRHNGKHLGNIVMVIECLIWRQISNA